MKSARLLPVATIIAALWTTICWFAKPFSTPFFHLPVFKIDASIPFIITIILLLASFFLWLHQKGKTTLNNFSSWIKQNKTTSLVLLIILVGHLVIQLPATIMIDGAHDADSALYGIAGFHIVDDDIRPMFNLGKHHMGSLVPHISAVFVKIFGKSPIYLRIIVNSLYFGFLIILFILVRNTFDNKTALVATLLAAIPTKEVFQYLKHPENAVALFCGALAFYILVRIVEEDVPSFARYFSLGGVLGIAFWSNFQFIYFIVACFFVLLIKDKLFFLKLRPYAIVLGMMTGGIVIIIDGFYYSWPIFSFFMNSNAGLGLNLSGLLSATQTFLFHIPTLLGTTGTGEVNIFQSSNFFPVWYTVLFASLFAGCFFVHLYQIRGELKKMLTGKNFSAKKILFFVFFFSVFLIYVLSSYSKSPSSPMRYILPIWVSLIVIIASSIVFLGKFNKYLATIGISIFAATFLFSNYFEQVEINYRQDLHEEWVAFLKDHDINAFYGPWIRTYWTTFVTNEEIVGAPRYPTSWNPCSKYQILADKQKGNVAYLFGVIFPFRKDLLADRLDSVGVGHKELRTLYGDIVYGLSERVTPGQLASLEVQKYQALLHLEESQVVKEHPDKIIFLKVSVSNTGETKWFANAQTGHVELLVKTEDQLLRQLHIQQNLEVNEQLSMNIVLTEEELTSNILDIQMAVNGLVISEKKTPLTIDTSLIELTERDKVAQLIKYLEVDDDIDLTEREELFVKGWGKVLSTKKGFISRYSSGKKSRIHFYTSKNRSLFFGANFSPLSGRNMEKGIQKLRVSLNGNVLKKVELEKAKRIVIPLPAHILKKGMNEIVFEYDLVEPEFHPTRSNPNFRIRPRAILLNRLYITTMRTPDIGQDIMQWKKK